MTIAAAHPGSWAGSAAGVSLVRPERLADAIRNNRLGDFKAVSEVAACLMPLLSALGWRGSARDMAESLPHFADTLDLIDLRNVLVSLGYESQEQRCRLAGVDPRLLPALFVSDTGATYVLAGRDGNCLRAFDGGRSDWVDLPADRTRGRIYLFTEIPAELTPQQRAAAGPWFGELAKRFRGAAYPLVGVTLVLNVLALAVPIFIMVVYDKVIGSRSVDTLSFLVVGLAVALVADLALRHIRAHMIGAIAGRLDYILGAEAFKQILTLPPSFTERATVGSQISRIKEFESVREFFTGPLATTALEIPFVILFVIVIAFIGGPIAFVPIAMIVAFIAFGWYWLPVLRDTVTKASRARSDRHAFLVETVANMRGVKVAAAQETWRDRFRTLSANAVTANFDTAKRQVILQTAAHVLMTVSGIAVLAIGTFRVMDGLMTVGALIATMILVWKVLSPLQTGFLAFTRLEQVKLGIRQLNQLMQLPPEHQLSRSGLLARKFKGQVAFNRVSFRYSADTDPAMLGASFTIDSGELVTVIGNNGSGKTTMLKLIAGMYTPQAGTVTVDGLDIRQLDPGELRRSVGYVPKHPHLFHGTIAQNLRLSDPTASDEQLARATAEAGVLHTILQLPRGFETRIGDSRKAHLPYGFSQRMAMARALVRDAPILLLDEPATSLDEVGDSALISLLKRLRGQRTVFMISHRPSHIRLSDRVIVLDRGAVAFMGGADEALDALRRIAQ